MLYVNCITIKINNSRDQVPGLQSIGKALQFSDKNISLLPEQLQLRQNKEYGHQHVSYSHSSRGKKVETSKFFLIFYPTSAKFSFPHVILIIVFSTSKLSHNIQNESD